MRACQVIKQGIKPSELKVSLIEKPKIESNQILIKNNLAGLNFVDISHRSGASSKPVPFVLGLEGVGVVEEVGSAVDTTYLNCDRNALKGKRVFYMLPGTYAEYTIGNPNFMAVIPDEISDEMALASGVQGMTAKILVKDVGKLKSGMSVLVQAVAGGTGHQVAQMAKAEGATVIGACSTKKVDIVNKTTNGCVDHIIDYMTSDVAAEVKKLTDGKGVNVAIDGVGKATFEGSLNSVRSKGLVISFGNASGEPPAVAPSRLGSLGSLFLTKPTLFAYIDSPGDFQKLAAKVWKYIKDGKLKPEVDTYFDLSEASKAHEYIEKGETKGKVIIRI